MEDMPEAFINLGDEVLRATPENSRLITFLGREALNCILRRYNRSNLLKRTMQ